MFLEGDKVLYFLKAIDMNDRWELGSLLEDETQPNGLITNWVVVRKACDQFDNRRRWLDDSDMAGPVVRRRKALIATEMTKQREPTARAMENSVIEELARKFAGILLAIMSRQGPEGKTHIDVYGGIVLIMQGKIVRTFKMQFDKTLSIWKATLYTQVRLESPCK